MNYIRHFIPALFVALLVFSCKKEAVKQEPVSSITIANMIVGGTAAKLGGIFAPIQNINNNGAANFTLPAGQSRLYVWPIGDSLHPYYDQPITTGDRQIHSLFLTGTPDDIESLLIKEDLPVHNDSAFGVRFINLSPESPAVKVTLSTSTTTSEFGDIEYKDVSGFKTYPALSVNTLYSFQVRNAATDAVISSINITGASLATGIPRFNNITLVLRGKVGGSPAAGISRVNNF